MVGRPHRIHPRRSTTPATEPTVGESSSGGLRHEAREAWSDGVRRRGRRPRIAGRSRRPGARAGGRGAADRRELALGEPKGRARWRRRRHADLGPSPRRPPHTKSERQRRFRVAPRVYLWPCFPTGARRDRPRGHPDDAQGGKRGQRCGIGARVHRGGGESPEVRGSFDSALRASLRMTKWSPARAAQLRSG